MAAYVLVDVGPVHPEDREAWQRYLEMAPPTIEQYGGKYLTRGGSIDVMEGGWHPRGIVIVEFPNKAAVDRWYTSPEYAPARQLRESSGLTRNMINVEDDGDGSSDTLGKMG